SAHAYSYMFWCVTTHGYSPVHARSHVSGSSTVNRYSRLPSDIREMRSTTCSLSLDPRNCVLPVKLVVSMTNVSPSQWPTESPIHFRIDGGRCGWFMRTTRASCTISVRIITVSRVCTIWWRLL